MVMLLVVLMTMFRGIDINMVMLGFLHCDTSSAFIAKSLFCSLFHGLTACILVF